MRFLSLLRVARAGLITKLPEIDIHCNVSGWAGELRGRNEGSKERKVGGGDRIKRAHARTY